MKRLILYGILHFLQEEFTIVYPGDCNIEDYVLDLESEFYKEFKQSMRNAKVTYMDYRSLQKSTKLKENVLVDPRCYMYELSKRQKLIEEIESKCKTWV